MEEVTEPLKGYGVQEALKAGIKIKNWDELKLLKKRNKIQIPNQILQMKPGF